MSTNPGHAERQRGRKHEALTELNIHDKMDENILINTIGDKVDIENLNQQNISLFSLLKMNFLLKEMIKLGGLNNENFEPILDLHQDITLPNYDLIDLEAAGVPNEFTNTT